MRFLQAQSTAHSGPGGAGKGSANIPSSRTGHGWDGWRLAGARRGVFLAFAFAFFFPRDIGAEAYGVEGEVQRRGGGNAAAATRKVGPWIKDDADCLASRRSGGERGCEWGASELSYDDGPIGMQTPAVQYMIEAPRSAGEREGRGCHPH